MKKKEEAKYLDREWLLMTANLKAFFETEDQEALHKFRVAVKKLRAMLYLFEIADDDGSLMKLFKPVRKIFKHAGVIRDAHINLLLAKQYKLKNDLFESSQRQVIESGIIDFRTNSEEYFKTLKDGHKKIKKQLNKLSDKDIAAYYRQQLEQIAANMDELQFNEELHTSRKLIKILMYNKKLAEAALEGTVSLNISYLDKLQDTIGEWHDNIVTAELFAQPEFHDKVLVAKLKRANTTIRRNIATMAKDFLVKATTAETTAI